MMAPCHLFLLELAKLFCEDQGMADITIQPDEELDEEGQLAAPVAEAEAEPVKKGPPEIIVSQPVQIDSPESLKRVIGEHQRWLDSVLDPRKSIQGGRANLKGAKLSGYDLTGVNLSGATLADADLSQADLSGSNFTGADFSGANLRGARLYKTKLKRANLSQADFREAELVEVDLGKANTDGTQFPE